MSLLVSAQPSRNLHRAVLVKDCDTEANVDQAC